MPSSERPAAVARPAVIAWQQVEDLLRQIAVLAKSEQSPGEFAAAACRQIQQALEASRAAIWLRDAAGDWSLAANCSDGDEAPREPGQSPSASSTLLAPFALDAEREGAVEIEFAANDPRRDALPAGVGEALAELVGDYFRANRLRELHQGDRDWRQLNQISAHLHDSLDPEMTAFRIANDGRNWLECDRLSVVSMASGIPSLLAMSGVDRVDRRAQLVRSLETLVAAVGPADEAMWFDGAANEQPREIEVPLHAFLEHSPAKVLAIVPLLLPRNAAPDAVSGKPVGWLVIESFDQLPDTTALRERTTWLVPQAATALNNAIQHRRIPWSRWFDRWAKVDRCRVGSRLALVLAGIGLVALALVLIPANFYVEARGELLPQNRQEIFAPADGVIDRVAVKHGQAVSSHDLLVTLKQAELELEQARVDGALATARKKLAATQALQFESPRTRDSSPERLHQLAADEEELKELIRGLENQQKILAARQQALTVTSPLTGKILTWNVEPLLSARPVTRGQHLMTVADVAGPWELTLAVPDDRMGHVLFARQHRQQPMRVSFVVATDPGREYFAALDSIAQLTETDAEGRATVAAVVELPPGTIADPRPGAEVIAHIHCGRRSLGYVWFHDLIDAVRSWFFY